MYIRDHREQVIHGAEYRMNANKKAMRLRASFLTVASVGTAVLNEHSAKGGTYEL